MNKLNFHTSSFTSLTRCCFFILIFLFLFSACTSNGSDNIDAGVDSDTDSSWDGGPDSSQDAGDAQSDGDSGVEIETVEVSHERELRGVWIASVFNINWPSQTGLSASAQREELESLLDVAVQAKMNAVFFQIRAESDAFYVSDIEPWSRFLSGTSGENPGWDPLMVAIEEAHKRGLELHAWVNPYRALASSNVSAASPSHIIHSKPEIVVQYGSLYWIDPGNPEGQSHTLEVIEDILLRYDIDGLHFDDYFYPYPEAGLDFPDDDTYAAHSGGLSRDDWRRQNVNQMVAEVYGLVQDLRPEVRFGISPFGIYRPGTPEGITGLDQWSELFADPIAWMETGDVDYIAPQLYWPTTRSGQEYGILMDWWAVQAQANGRDLYIGNYLSKLGTASDWSREEFEEQFRLVREDSRVLGTIQYQIQPLIEDRDGITSYFSFYNSQPAATPPIPDATETPEPPIVTIQGAQITLSGDGKCFAIYKEEDSNWVINKLLYSDQTILYQGRWAVSVVGYNSLESLGVVVTIEEGEPPLGQSCTHSYGGVYAHSGCSASYQCCDGVWEQGLDICGSCICVEETGAIGCE
jgi:uncharacterized lipoprotein YddW (UPF0748 family)